MQLTLWCRWLAAGTKVLSILIRTLHGSVTTSRPCQPLVRSWNLAWWTHDGEHELNARPRQQHGTYVDTYSM